MDTRKHSNVKVEGLTNVLRVKELIKQGVDERELDRMARVYGLTRSELIEAATNAAEDMTEYRLQG